MKCSDLHRVYSLSKHRLKFYSESMGLSTLFAMAFAVSAPQTIFVADINASGLDREQIILLDRLIGESLKRHARATVITRNDLEEKLNMENNKQLAGCDYESCAAELAQALGADFHVTGTWAKLGKDQILQLNLVGDSVGEPLSRVSITLDDDGDVRRVIEVAVIKLLGPMAKEGANDALLVDEGKPSRTLWVASAGVCGLLTVAALGVVGVSASQIPNEDLEKSRREGFRTALYAGAVAAPIFLLGTALSVWPLLGDE